MVTFVALSLLLLGAANPLPSADSPSAPDHAVSAAGPIVAGATQHVPHLDPQSPPDAGNPVRMCLKIRAYIFNVEDDSVPRLVRETTCPDVRVRTKSVQGETPKPGPAVQDAVLR